MEFDLNYRNSRLSKEIENRKIKLNYEKLKEIKKLERIQQIQEKESKRLFLLKQEQELLQEQQRHEEYLNNLECDGIHVYDNQLIPYIITLDNHNEYVYDDKVILSEDILLQLLKYDAYSKGPMYFKLKVRLKCLNTNTIIESDSITYCGVKEFTANKGTIGITSRISDTILNKYNNHTIQSIDIKYVRLPKVSYAKLQPLHNQFFKVEAIKLCLEENFKKYSTLSLNDIITIWYRGKAYPMSVMELKPDGIIGGSLIDSDVEIDLYTSKEYEEYQQTQTLQSVSQTNDKSENTPHDKLITSSDNVIFNEIIPEEPEVSENVIAIKINTPNGTNLVRRFIRNQPMKYLFYYILQNIPGDSMKLRLSQRFSSRILELSHVVNNETFEDLQFTSKQELFIASFSN